MAEIDDRELASLRAGYALLDGMLKNPKTKRTVEKAVKEVNPELVTDDDRLSPYIEEFRGTSEKIDKFINTMTEREQDRELQAGLDAARKQYSLTDEGLEKVKELMVKKKIPDPLDAAAVYAQMTPPPKPQPPTGFAPTTWGIGAETDDVDTKLLFQDEDAWAEKTARLVWDEETRAA